MRYFEKTSKSQRDTKKKIKKGGGTGYSVVNKKPDAFTASSSASAPAAVESTAQKNLPSVPAVEGTTTKSLPAVSAVEGAAQKKPLMERIGGKIKGLYNKAEGYIARKQLEKTTLVLPKEVPGINSGREARIQERLASPEYKAEVSAAKKERQNPHGYNRLDRDYYKQHPELAPHRMRQMPEKSLATSRTFTPEERARKSSPTTVAQNSGVMTPVSSQGESYKVTPTRHRPVIRDNQLPVSEPETSNGRTTRGSRRAERMRNLVDSVEHKRDVRIKNYSNQNPNGGVERYRREFVQRNPEFAPKRSITPEERYDRPKSPMVGAGTAEAAPVKGVESRPLGSSPNPSATPRTTVATPLAGVGAGAAASSTESAAGKAGAKFFSKETVTNVKNKATEMLSSGKAWAKANPKMAIGAGAAASAAVAGAGALAYNALRPKTFAEKAMKFVKKNPLAAGAAAIGIGGAAAMGMNKQSSIEDIKNKENTMRYFEKISEETLKDKAKKVVSDASDMVTDGVKKGKAAAGKGMETAERVAKDVAGKAKNMAGKASGYIKANPKLAAGIGAGAAAAAAAGGIAYKALNKKTLVEKALKLVRKNPLAAGAAAVGVGGATAGAVAYGTRNKKK